MKFLPAALGLPLVLLPAVASAANPEEVASRAQSEILDADRQVASVQASVNSARSKLLTPEQRLANGEILYRMKDYARAADVLSEIIEGYPNTPSHPDAMWLRGETFLPRTVTSARRDYRQLVDRSSEPRFAPYSGRALARLVDVSIRSGDVASLEEVYQAQQVPPAQVDAAIHYARGKAAYFRKEYDAALPHSRRSPRRRRTRTRRATSRASSPCSRRGPPRRPPPPIRPRASRRARPPSTTSRPSSPSARSRSSHRTRPSTST